MASTPAVAAADTDGRTERRMRNRIAVLDAVIEMFGEGIASPSMDEVADRADVSVRSVYRYFDTRELLVRAAVERLLELAGPFAGDERSTAVSLEARVRHVAEQRVALYFQFAPLARVAITIGRSDPLVQEVFEFGRDALRQHFLDQFEPELGGLSARRRTFVVLLATIPLQFHSFDHLHRRCGYGAAEMEGIVVQQMMMHLTSV